MGDVTKTVTASVIDDSIEHQLQWSKHSELLYAWQEAEKKVIFKQHLTQDYLKNKLKVSTLGQLSEKIKGLELKNVNL